MSIILLHCFSNISLFFVFVFQDLLMYLLQLVQALKYENFDDIKNGLEPTKKDSQGSVSESVSNSGINSAEIDRYGYPGGLIFKSNSLPPFQISSPFLFPQMFQTLVGTKFKVLPMSVVCGLREHRLLYCTAVFCRLWSQNT